MSTISETLSTLGTSAFRWSAIAFLMLNGFAVLTVLFTRDRALVNRWTSKLLLANLLLLGTGLGIPAVTAGARMVVDAVAATVGGGGGAEPESRE